MDTFVEERERVSVCTLGEFHWVRKALCLSVRYTVGSPLGNEMVEEMVCRHYTNIWIYYLKRACVSVCTLGEFHWVRKALCLSVCPLHGW